LLLAAAAQEKPAEPKFSSKASYVLLPVLVTDNKGVPIYDLKQEDFIVKADKDPQPIASFEAPPKITRTIHPPVAAAAPVEFSNIGSERPRHVTIIALDPKNTPFNELKPTNDAVLHYLTKSIGSNEPIELIWFNDGKIEILRRFTTDYAALADVLEKTKFPADTNYEIPIDTSKMVDMGDLLLRKSKMLLREQERQMQRRVEEDKANLLAMSMMTTAAYYRAIPGPKTLLWVSHGFRLRQQTPVLSDGGTMANSGRGTPTTLWENAFKELANANIAVYPIDARGLAAPNDISDKSDVDSTVMEGPGSRVTAQVKANFEYVSALNWIAAETGGIAFTNSNGFETAIDRAIADSQGAYMLSFRVPTNFKPGWHPIKVQLQRKGIQVVTRPGFWLEKGKSRNNAETIEAALSAPFAMTGLPVMVRWTEVKQPNAKGKSQIGFQVAVPSAMPTSPDFSQHRVSMQVRAVAYDHDQKPITGTKRDITMDLDETALQKLMKSAVSYSGSLELPAGEYEVAFAVRDNVSGRVGSAMASLTVK
jgi:VWFA-related protein